MGQGLRGVWTASLSLILLYAVYLGFAALTVLTLALDSKGSVDPLLAGQGGWLLLLLSLGVGVNFFGVLIGLPALLATLLDILLLASLVRRRPLSGLGFFLGLCLWTGVIIFASSRSGLDTTEGLFLIGLRAAVLFTVGCLWGSRAVLAERLRSFFTGRGAPAIPLIGRQALLCLKYVVLAVTAESLIVLAVWAIQNHAVMGKVIAMTGMPTGSAVITTVLSLFWLPNLALWALSWLVGAGFQLGSLGSFSLWIGTAHDLPPVPVFGLFPQALTSDSARVFLLVLPLLIGAGVGLLRLTVPGGFRYLATLPTDRSRPASSFVQLLIVKAVYPLASFCLSSVLLVFLAAAAFSLSNGRLGTGNLAWVGVDVAASTQALARPTFAGLLVAWVLLLVCFCLGQLIHASRQRQAPNTRLEADDLIPLGDLPASTAPGQPDTAAQSPPIPVSDRKSTKSKESEEA